MKKNITINLFGRLYAIDEDAYQLLMEYEESLRNYFSKQDSGGEIVNDLEARIAELMDELKAEGHEAVNIEDVQNIILRIGNPKQMEEGISEELGGRGDVPEAEEETDNGETSDSEEGKGESEDLGNKSESTTSSSKRKKSFYRDTKDTKLLGVLSGCAAYFGGSALVWRLCFVALFFCGWMFGDIILPRFTINSFDYVSPSMLLNYHSWTMNLHWWLIPAYFIVAIIAPKASTPEERLRMKGKDVNPETLAKEVAIENQQPATSQDSGCANGCLNVLIIFFKFIAYSFLFVIATGIILFILFILGTILIVAIPVASVATLPFKIALDYALEYSGDNVEWCIIGWIIVLAIPIYCLVHSILVGKGKAKRMGALQRTIWVVLWIAAFVVGIVTVSRIGGLFFNKQFQIGLNQHINAESEAQYQDSLNDGTWMTPEDSTFLADGGWKLIKRENCHKQGYTLSGEYYTSNDSVRYLDAFNDYGKQIFRAERTETGVKKGTYTLTSVARAWGDGAFIYAIADSMLYMKEIPKCGNVGGDIWKEASANLDSIKVRKIEDDDVLRMSDEERRLQKIASANNGKGYGWCKVTLTGIKSESGIISYGITNDSELTGERFRGEWFSATDFELKKE